MTKVLTVRRRMSVLLAAAAPVALMLGLASPASAQVATPGGNTAAGVVLDTYTMSGAGPSFGGATSNTGAADTSTITLNDSRTLLNWNSFVLAPGDTLNFNMASPAGIALNRVLGGSGTVINGNINSNGAVWFLDSSGIAVGGTATINVGGLLLSPLGLADADFFGADASFHFTGVGGGTVAVNGGAALNASSGAVTLLGPSITFSGAASASGSIGLFGARNATLVFDNDLDAYVALTVASGSDQATAVTVGSQASFNAAAAAAGGRTYLIAAGDSGALGSILLGGSAADAVEFIEGDVVLYAAGESTFDRELISGGVLQASTGTGGGDVTIGAATVSAGDLNVIAADDLTVTDQISVLTGSARFESIDMTSIAVGVQVGRDYTLRAPDWTGGAAFSPVFLNAGSGVGDFTIEDTAWGLTIGGRTAPGRFSISTLSGPLTIMGGAITAGDGISLSTSGGDLTLAANLVDTGGDDAVSLTSSGAILQTGGFISGGALTVSAGGVASLTGANTITSLGVSSADGLTLTDVGGLSVTGTVNGGAGGVSLTTSGDLTVGGLVTAVNGPISLTATGAASDIVLNAGANAGSGTVTLTAMGAGGTISQSASGVITAGTLTGSASGAATLTAATNVIAGLGAFTGSGVSLRDASGLTVSGTVNGGAGGVSLTTSGDLTVNADIISADAAISLSATGANADVRLNAAVNAGTGTVTLTATGTNGAISQNAAGVITAGLLTGASAGATVLTADNALAGLGSFSANGFALANADSLVISGAVSGGGGGVDIGAAGDLAVNGAVTAANGPISLGAGAPSGDLTLTSAVNAGAGTVTLSAGDAIAQTAGGLTAGVLTVTAGGGASLAATAADNDVAQLGAAAADAFSFRNVDGFTTGGAITAAGDVTLIAETGSLTLGGNVTGDVVSLTASTSDILQSAGVVTANTLNGFASRNADLSGANQIANLGGFVANALTLVDEGGLTVVGQAGSGAGGGDVVIRTAGGPLTLTSTAQVTGGIIVLSTDGAFVNQSGADALASDGQWTIYAASPDTSVFDNLNSGHTAIWNGTLATRAPSGLTGDRYVFAYQPTLTVTTLGTGKVYGTDLSGSTAGLWAVSGYHAGVSGAFLADTASTAFSGAPTISSAGLAERASVAGGPYAVTATLGSMASDSGYAFGFSNLGEITVTPKALTAVVVAADKTYDGATTASGSVSLGGVLSGDAVSTTTGTFAFADRNAGVDKVVTVSGVSLTGADAGNYSVTVPASVLADILRREITATATADDKTYDGTTAGSGSVALSGVLGSDSVSATGGAFTFADENAGVDKTVQVSGVSLTGSDAANYVLSLPASTVATILRRTITANVSAASKTYDGTTAANGAVTLNGVLGGDDVGTAGGLFAFQDANAGNGKTVSVSGVGLTGTDAANYTVIVPASTVANILRRAITVSADAISKAEGEADPTLTYAVTSGGLVSGDSLTGALARDPGEAPGDYAVTQGSLAASSNYQLTFVGNTLTITAVATTPLETPSVQEAHDLVRFLARYDPAIDHETSLIVADEREPCSEGAGEGLSACGETAKPSR